MALQGKTIIRKFRYNGMTLSDPSAEKTPDQVRMVFATQYPELLNSVIEGPVTKNGISTYTFARAVGSKGIGHLSAMRSIAKGEFILGNNPLANASFQQIQEAKSCSTIVQSIVNSREKSTPLIAPASAYSRFG